MCARWGAPKARGYGGRGVKMRAARHAPRVLFANAHLPRVHDSLSQTRNEEIPAMHAHVLTNMHTCIKHQTTTINNNNRRVS